MVLNAGAALKNGVKFNRTKLKIIPNCMLFTFFFARMRGEKMAICKLILLSFFLRYKIAGAGKKNA
ncbi:hypothetical protein EJ73_01092 [Hoylesella shahii DSM 15611 = JCM 12083]|uniref:Uncharacterized protein n=1 Tax=Hoylesella shahii DSM 15611 = JCM 12083 TaxID=1122991 RepID=A0A318HWJ7_9BACT|nr:hypothetical protein [Hoylesella shahii]PXX22814.1 hypothetical protein EJ73_01092 [Hoylesella shahii DSM 15611 = JCM 12083]